MANGSPSLAAKFLQKFALVANHGQSLFLFLIRLYGGFICARSGYRHLTNFQSTVDTFRDSFHVPMPTINAAISGSTELVCGALLLVGLASRIISIPLLINFVVAILASNLSDPRYREPLLHFWNNPDVLIKDDAFPFLLISLIVLIFGPGWISIDGIVRRWHAGRGAQRP